jgi:hypothetical protein
MNNVHRIAGAILSIGMTLAATQAMGADAAAKPDPETRQIARMMAQIEMAMEKRDLKGYCAATSGSPDYTGTVALACLERAEEKRGKLEDCSLPKILSQVKKDRDQCLAMSTEEFQKRISNFPGGRDKWVKSLKQRGVDGDKLLQEERSKL